MRVVLGMVAVAAGAGGLASWLAPAASDADLAVVSAVGAGGVARLSMPGPDTSKDAANTGGARFFGFALPKAGAANGAVPVVPPSPVGDVAQSPAPAPAPAATPPQPKSWSRDVEIYPGGREGGLDAAAVAPARVVAPKPMVAPAAVAALPPRDRPRAELVRDLQRELKRIGCYAGDVDGSWGPGSRRSMQAFMEQVNSSLQSDDPDLIQLTLVRGYSGLACRGAPGANPGIITAGRTPAAPGPRESSPAQVPSYASAPAGPVVTGSVEIVAPAPVRVVPPLEGRMAIGAPMPESGPRDGASLVGPPVPPGQQRAARPRSSSQQAQAPRRERNWTANFFGQ